MNYRFDFDEQLPDLPTAFDLEAVEQMFQERWPATPGFNGEAFNVEVKRMQDTKYKPAQRCVNTYEIVVERPGQPPLETIGVVEVYPDRLNYRLFDDDPKLPWLAPAIDPAVMQAHFANLLQAAGGGQLKEIVTVRYKPGLHCVFRYTVQTPAGEEVFYGKLFHKDGPELFAMIQELYRVSEATPAMPRISPPLAYWPDVQLLIQPAVAGGIELRSFAFDTTQEPERREYWVRMAGANVAALHAAQVETGECRTFEDELEDLDEYRTMVAKVNPKLETRFENAVSKIRLLAKDLPEPPLASGHGALRTDQFIIQGDHLVMIDLDGFCHANPARDIGNFLAYLGWKAIRQPEHAAFVERLGQAFLDAYQDAGGRLDDRWLTLYQAASLLKIAGRRFRSLTFREWPLVTHLLEAVDALLKDWPADNQPGTPAEVSSRKILHLTTSSDLTKFPAVFIDAEFPALWHALNAEIMSDEISPLLGEAPDCPGRPASLQAAKLLAYKPGKRGVIRYEVRRRECDGEHTTIFGKLYPEPHLADRAYRVMQALWRDVFSEGERLGVPQPLGCIPQLSMLVFKPAEGQLLGDAISDTPRVNARSFEMMDMAGTWLAVLHTHSLPLEKQFQIGDEYDNIEQWAGLIAEKYPEQSDAAWRLANALLDQAHHLQFDLHVPIHKDFHYEHILVNGGLKVIDFDEMRLGDANLDLAHFCANFYLLAYRKNKHPAQFAQLQNRFINAYARLTGWEMDERFAFFYAYTCLKITKQLCKLRGPRPWPQGEEQRGQVWLMLEQGLTMSAFASAKPVQRQASLPIVDFSQERRSVWSQAHRISKSATSSAAIHASHKLLS